MAIVNSAVTNIPYLPLETTRKEVRFLQAHRRDTDGHIIVSLKHFPLQEEECPRFTALSYVWGEHEHHPETITVDGHTCSVLESIYPILSLLCDHVNLQHETWFWIDYLCINQHDPAERATQVALMGDLYRLAFRTIVWLGESSPDIAGAASTLRQIAATLPRHPDPSITSAQWDALNLWMARPWWTRVWTLQEFLLPDRLVFHCGGESVTKHTWATAIAAIYDCGLVGGRRPGPGPEERAFGNQWARKRLLEYYDDDRLRERMGLVAMMAYVGYYKASDDRDRIYAMLGICTDVDRLIVGAPDYSKTVDETYIALARQFILIHRSLDIICFSMLFNNNTKPAASEEKLPSWVPDWRRWASPASRPVPSMVSEPSRNTIGNFRPSGRDPDPDVTYRASGRTKSADVSFSKDGRSLTCHGLVIDVLDGLGPVSHPAPDPNADKELHLVQAISETNTRPRGASSSALDRTLSRATSDAVVEALVRSVSLDRAGRYLNFAAQTAWYAHELQNALADTSRPRPPKQTALMDWMESNQGLCVQGATLGQHFEEAASSPPSGEDGHPRRAARKQTLWRAAETTVGERPWDCRLVVTEGGSLGMAPRGARRGDVVVVLFGCSVPVVLRREDGEGNERYVVVGECFLSGFMDGEALGGGREEREFVLV